MKNIMKKPVNIEGLNRQLRKVTKSKAVFPTDDSLFKMLYLAMMDITKKWTGRRQDWGMIHAQLSIYFADRIPDQRKSSRLSRVEKNGFAALDNHSDLRYNVIKRSLSDLSKIRFSLCFTPLLRSLHKIRDRASFCSFFYYWRAFAAHFLNSLICNRKAELCTIA